MDKELKTQIEALSIKARDLEHWIYDNMDDPAWNSKVNQYNCILFQLAQKREQLYNLEHQVVYRPTASLPRFVNKSTSVTR